MTAGSRPLFGQALGAAQDQQRPGSVEVRPQRLEGGRRLRQLDGRDPVVPAGQRDYGHRAVRGGQPPRMLLDGGQAAQPAAVIGWLLAWSYFRG